MSIYKKSYLIYLGDLLDVFKHASPPPDKEPTPPGIEPTPTAKEPTPSVFKDLTQPVKQLTHRRSNVMFARISVLKRILAGNCRANCRIPQVLFIQKQE